MRCMNAGIQTGHLPQVMIYCGTGVTTGAVKDSRLRSELSQEDSARSLMVFNRTHFPSVDLRRRIGPLPRFESQLFCAGTAAQLREPF